MNRMQCGFPTVRQVALYSFPLKVNGSSITSRISPVTGISLERKDALPMFTRNSVALAFRHSTSMVPDKVSMANFFSFTYSLSMRYFAKMHTPFPLMAASLPSELKMRIPIFPFISTGPYRTPSAPSPKPRWQRRAIFLP